MPRNTSFISCFHNDAILMSSCFVLPCFWSRPPEDSTLPSTFPADEFPFAAGAPTSTTRLALIGFISTAAGCWVDQLAVEFDAFWEESWKCADRCNPTVKYSPGAVPICVEFISRYLQACKHPQLRKISDDNRYTRLWNCLRPIRTRNVMFILFRSRCVKVWQLSGCTVTTIEPLEDGTLDCHQKIILLVRLY